jgi:hypothetical protein
LFLEKFGLRCFLNDGDFGQMLRMNEGRIEVISKRLEGIEAEYQAELKEIEKKFRKKMVDELNEKEKERMATLLQVDSSKLGEFSFDENSTLENLKAGR